ncbi:MAG: S41 family peptidase [Myxococcota bacterium]|nr:S41 family peptidase [Myxococcota bacterium]MEC8425429.1 S41 family peptidase [Myxococcota bacterium]
MTMHGLGWLLGLLGCHGSPPDPFALLEAGNITAAATTLAQQPDHELASLGKRLQQLETERAAVRDAEGAMLRSAAVEALESGDLPRAATVLASARRGTPEDPDLVTLAQRLRAALPSAPPGARAQVLLTEAGATTDPVKARALERAAAIATAEARIEPPLYAQVRSEQGGASVVGAQELLALIDTTYYRPVPWPDCASLAQAALHAIRTSPVSQARWPAIGDVAPPQAPVTDLASAQAAVAREVDVYTRADVPAEVVIDTWVRGALAALDPWSLPVWPAGLQSWSDQHAGTFQGVGLVLADAPDGRVLVRTLLPGSPAWTSGIHQGDILVSVLDDSGALALGEREHGTSLVRARDRLLGPSGSTVTLTTRRGNETHQTTLERGPVTRETVEGWARAADNRWQPWLDEVSGIAYVRIRRFKPPTEMDFDAMLEPHLGAIRGLVLDLRGNPGGDINSAVQIADRFVSNGRLAELHGRVLPETGPDIDPVTGEPLAAWNDAIPGHALEGMPVVVLVDAESASATEVLAGALQERADALVLGEATWGKGHAQALRIDESERFAVQFTNVVWALPSGRRLARGEPGGGGISPDIALVLSPAERFQIDRSARARGALRVHADGHPMTWSDPGRRDDLPPLSDDPAARAAELALRARLVANPRWR